MPYVPDELDRERAYECGKPQKCICPGCGNEHEIASPDEEIEDDEVKITRVIEDKTLRNIQAGSTQYYNYEKLLNIVVNDDGTIDIYFFKSLADLQVDIESELKHRWKEI